MSGVDHLRQAASARRAEVSSRLDTSPSAMETSLDKVLVRAATSGTTGVGVAVPPPNSPPSQPGSSSGTGVGPWTAGAAVLLGGGLLVAAVATSTSSDASDTAAAPNNANVVVTEVAAPAVAPSPAQPISDPVVTEVAATVTPTIIEPPAEETDTQGTTTIAAPVLVVEDAGTADGSTTGGATGSAATGGNDTAGNDTGADTGAGADSGAAATGSDTGSGSDASSTAGLDSGSGGESDSDSGSDTGSGTSGVTSGGDATGGETTGADSTGRDDPPPPPPPSSTCGSTAGLPAGAVAVIAEGGDFDGDGDVDAVGLYNTASGPAVVVDRSGVGLSDVGFVGEKPLGDLSGGASVRGVRTEGAEIDFGIVVDDLDDDGSTVWLRPFAVGDCAVTALELPREPGEPGGDVWGGSGYSDDGVDFGLQCVVEGEVTIVTFLSDFEVGALVAFDPAEPSLSFVDDAAATNQGCWK